MKNAVVQSVLKIIYEKSMKNLFLDQFFISIMIW